MIEKLCETCGTEIIQIVDGGAWLHRYLRGHDHLAWPQGVPRPAIQTAPSKPERIAKPAQAKKPKPPRKRPPAHRVIYLRVPDCLYDDAAQLADARGESLNTFGRRAIRREVNRIKKQRGEL